jgi:AcrR family transcriptional regulator
VVLAVAKKNSGSGSESQVEVKRGKQETREQLLKAAMELFAEKGYRGTSVRNVASKAGVTTGAFYSNFRSKRDIYIAIIDEITNTIQNIVDEITQEIIEVMRHSESKKMGFHVLQRPIHRLMDEAFRHESLMQIMRREGLGRDPEFQRDIDRVWERLVEAAKRALDTYVAAGFAKQFDTDLVARATVSMAIAMSLFDIQTRGEKREDIVGLMASMLHGGVSQWVEWKDIGR